jgi:hypothetical protein
MLPGRSSTKTSECPHRRLVSHTRNNSRRAGCGDRDEGFVRCQGHAIGEFQMIEQSLDVTAGVAAQQATGRGACDEVGPIISQPVAARRTRRIGEVDRSVGRHCGVVAELQRLTTDCGVQSLD